MQDEQTIEAEAFELPSDENIVVPEQAEAPRRTRQENLEQLGFGA